MFGFATPFVNSVLGLAGTLMDIAGVLVILIGIGWSAWVFGRRRGDEGEYREFRRRIGQSLLLGLEVLVAADIIKSVAVEPSFESLGVLAVLVAIRTFLSWSLEVELEGRWPWQRGRKAAPRESSSAG